LKKGSNRTSEYSVQGASNRTSLGFELDILNEQNHIRLSDSDRTILLSQLERDSNFLKNHRLIDYRFEAALHSLDLSTLIPHSSLLLGIHKCDKSNREQRRLTKSSGEWIYISSIVTFIPNIHRCLGVAR